MTTLVQSVNIQGLFVTSAGATFGSTPSAGNCIACQVGTYKSFGGTTISSVTDNKSNTYTLNQSSIFTNTNSGQAFALNISSSATFTVTVTIGGAGYIEAVASEWAGTATSSALDLNTSTGASDNADPNIPTTSSTAQNNEVILACATINASSANVGFTSPSGYTNLYTQQNAGTSIAFSADYKIVTSTGTENPTWGSNNTFENSWTATLISLKDASSAARVVKMAGEYGGYAGASGGFAG